MASWVLVPSLVSLRDEINRIAPNRSKTSDGTIGDDAHQDRVSSHNNDEVGKVPIYDKDKKPEVHALDIDVDLNESDLTMEKIVAKILSRCRIGQETRLRNIIYNRRIWAASSGWAQKTYTGDSPHTGHAHFEASYETAREADTSSWHLEEIPVSLTNADKNWIRQTITEVVAANNDDVARKVWDETENVNVGYKATNPDGSARPASMQKLRKILAFLSPEGHQTRDGVQGVSEQVAEVDAKVTALAGPDEEES